VSTAAGAIALAAIASVHKDLAIDEPFTALAIAHPSTLQATLVHDDIPAFYALLLAWTRVFGQSAFAMRTMSMAAFGAAIAFSAAASRRAAFGSAILVACSVTFGLQSAATARPYALLMMFAAMALWAGARADAPHGSRRDAFTLGTAHLLGLLTHPIFTLLTIASAIAGAVFAMRRVRLAAVPLTALAIYIIAWGSMLVRTASLPATSWIGRPAAADLIRGLLFWGDHATAIVLATIAILVWIRGTRALHEDTRMIGFALTLIALTLGMAFIVSQARPVFLASRTPVLVLPAAAVAIAIIVSDLAPLWVACALAGVVVVSAVRFTIRSALRPDPYPTRASLAAVAPRMKCGDVLIAAGLSYAPLTYYAPSAGVPGCVAIIPFPPDVREHPGWLDMTPPALSALHPKSEEIAASFTNAGALWVFAADKDTGAQAGTALRAALSRTRRPDESIELPGSFFDEVTVFRTTRGGPARP
jgi:hypothetical protein